MIDGTSPTTYVSTRFSFHIIQLAPFEYAEELLAQESCDIISCLVSTKYQTSSCLSPTQATELISINLSSRKHHENRRHGPSRSLPWPRCTIRPITSPYPSPYYPRLSPPACPSLPSNRHHDPPHSCSTICAISRLWHDYPAFADHQMPLVRLSPFSSALESGPVFSLLI